MLIYGVFIAPTMANLKFSLNGTQPSTQGFLVRGLTSTSLVMDVYNESDESIEPPLDVMFEFFCGWSSL